MNAIHLAEKETEQIEGSAIGNILLKSGRLGTQDLNRIIALQEKEHILFGEAAVALNVLSEEDVRWALSCQYSYPGINSATSPGLSELVVVNDPFNAKVESFRSVRSSLLLSGVGTVVKSISVVSPDEGEGKSFVAANLAVVFSQLGSKTILVDLNFRKPRIHEIFQLKNNTGSSSLIIKRLTFEQAVKQSAIESLDILTSGPKPPNPLELLSWKEAQEFIDSLKAHYDVVIIDTPAFSKTADATVISALCDGALLVARKGVTKNISFGLMKKQLDNANVRILGSVVNEVEGSRKS